MPDKDWFMWLADDIQIRIRMAKDYRGNVTQFTLQLELYLDIWRPVVRYDSAHQEAHIDYITPKGVTYEKVWLDLNWPFNEAMTRAIAERKQTYERHIERFHRQLGDQ